MRAAPIIFAGAVGLALMAGCATKRPVVPRAAATTAPAATKPTDRADLALDEIEPRPVLSASTRPAATTPSTTTTTTAALADRAPLDAIRLFAEARDSMIQGQRYTAINLLEKAIQLDPRSYELRFWLGQANGGPGMSQDPAIAAYEAAAALDDRHLAVHSELGRLYLARNQLTEAIQHLRLALQTEEYAEDDESAAVVDFYLAKALQQAGYDRAALDSYASLVERLQNGGLSTRSSPELAFLVNQPESLFVQVGELCERRGMFDEALRLYRLAAERRPNDFSYQAHVVRALASAGRRDEATKRATDMLRTFRASPEALALLKDVFRRSGGGDDAVARELDRLRRERPDDRAILYALVDVLAGSGRTQEAEKLLVGAARDARFDLDLVRRLFKLHDDAGNIDAAAKLLVEALAARPEALRDLSPMSAQLLRPWRKNHLTVGRLQALEVAEPALASKQYWLSEMARAWGRDVLSRTSLEQAVKHVPPFPPAYRLLLSRYWERTDWDQVQKSRESEALVSTVERQGDAALAAELRGLTFVAAGQPQQAVAQFRKAQDAGSDGPDLRLALATAIRATGDPEGAEQVLWKLVSDQPSCEDGYLNLFRMYLEAQQPDKAVRTLNTWLASDPLNVNAKILQATVLVQADRAADAERVLNDLLSREPDNAEVMSSLHQLYARTGRSEQFIEKLEAQRAARPENRIAVEQLVMIYASQKRLPEAIRVLDQARAAVKTDPDLLYYIGGLYARIGQRDVTEQVLEQVVAVDPEHAPACNDLGYTWADQGKNLARAEALIRIAVQREPDNQSFLDSLGWVLYKRGRFEAARQALEEAIGTSSLPDPIVLDHLGDTLYRLGLNQEAAARWKHSQQRLGPTGGAGGADSGDRDEIRQLRLQLQQKLKQAEAGQPVTVAPTAEVPANQAKN